MDKKVAVGLGLLMCVLWGSMCLPQSVLSDVGLSALNIAFLRMAFTTVMLFFILLIFDRDSLKVKKKDLWIFPIFGFMEFISEVLIFIALDVLPSGIATLLQMTSPFYVMILAFFFFKEKITMTMIAATIVAVIGCFFATIAADGTGRMDIIGILAGLGSGVAYAFFLVGSKMSMDRSYSPQCTLFYTFLFGAIFSAFGTIPNHENIATAFQSTDAIISILALSFFMTLVPYYLANVVLKTLGATPTSIIELTEIVFSTIIGVVFLHNPILPINIFGMILIMLSIVVMNVGIGYFFNLFKRKRERTA